MRKNIAILSVATAMLVMQASAQSNWESVPGGYAYTENVHLADFHVNMTSQTVEADYDVTLGEYFRVNGDTGSPADDAPWGLRFQTCPVDNSWEVHWTGTVSVSSGYWLQVKADEDDKRHEWEIWKYLPTGTNYRRDSNELIWKKIIIVEEWASQGDPGDPGF